MSTHDMELLKSIEPLSLQGFECFRILLDKVLDGVPKRFDVIATKMLESTKMFTQIFLDKGKAAIALENLYVQLKIFKTFEEYTAT